MPSFEERTVKMAERIEGLIKAVYKSWKKHSRGQEGHPGEEDLACFFEGKLNPEESEAIKTHLISCILCSQIFALCLEAEAWEIKEVPLELLNTAKEILSLRVRPVFLEIFLRVKENMLEIIKANADVLLGQELVPAPVLRSRKIKDFKDEVTLLKDFKDITLEVRIENKDGKYFNVAIKAKDKKGLGIVKDIRVTLIREGLELESYLSDSGMVSFEHILLGKYSLEIINASGKLASVILDVKA